MEFIKTYKVFFKVIILYTVHQTSSWNFAAVFGKLHSLSIFGIRLSLHNAVISM